MARTRKERDLRSDDCKIQKGPWKGISVKHTQGIVSLVDHGEFTSTFEGFLNNPIGV